MTYGTSRRRKLGATYFLRPPGTHVRVNVSSRASDDVAFECSQASLLHEASLRRAATDHREAP